MISLTRALVSAAALAAVTLLVAGCTASPPDAGTAPEGEEEARVGAAWLDEGRMFAIVTEGSSSCVPMVDEVSAKGQTVTVSLVEAVGDDVACTADFAPRASIGAFPEGVDPAADVELVVTLGDLRHEIPLAGVAGLTGIPGTPTDYAPSAGWVGEGSLVLLTWGSSSCPPVVKSVDGVGATGEVTFAESEGPCTMDMAPRATMLAFADDVDAADFQLTLAGANLDGTVRVAGR